MSYPEIMKGETLLGFETGARLFFPVFPLPFVFISRSGNITTLSPRWKRHRSVHESLLRLNQVFFVLSFYITGRKIPDHTFLAH